MPDAFDPYYQWLGIAPKDQPPHHYRLLGLDLFESTPEVIENAVDQRMLHLRARAAGKHAAASQRLLNEIAAAKICLLNAAKKIAYDAQLKARLVDAGTSVDEPVEPQTDGAVFGEYLLLDKLGSSYSGPVYKAQHRTMGRIVALKILSQEAMRSVEIIERFRRKIRILAQLRHPNLVTAYDAGERDGTHFLIMEYIDGWDGAALRKKFSPLSPQHVVNYTTQAATGLAFAHSQGIFHRNVKPANLMIDRHGIVKLIGLGLAHLREEARAPLGDPHQTLSGRVLGSFDYMAPEQALDSTQIDHRADIYSLGCTMYELLAGQPPYPAPSPAHSVHAHRNEAIPSLYAARPDTPLALQEVFERMVAKHPRDRYQFAADVIAALQTVFD